MQLISKTSKKFEKAKRYADCGGERPYDSYPSWDKEYTSFGENFKITEIQSVILNEQLKKLDKIYKKQIDNYNYLVNNLTEYSIRKVLPVKLNSTVKTRCPGYPSSPSGELHVIFKPFSISSTS